MSAVEANVRWGYAQWPRGVARGDRSFRRNARQFTHGGRQQPNAA